MSLSRTPSGLAAEHLFVQKVIVYIEGYTDKAFYEEVLQDYNCQITPRNGRRNCESLAAVLAQKNLPYVVVLDGDYEILERARSKHRRVVLLQRYSFENYLFEEKPIEQFCHDLINLDEPPDTKYREVIEDVEKKLKDLIGLDVAHRRSNTGYKVIPDNPDRFFKSAKKAEFKEDEIQKFFTAAATYIDKQSIDNANILIEGFLRKRRFIDLLPGHFAFGVMRRLVVATVKRSITNKEMRVYLSRVVWRLVKTPEHESLKRRLRRAVREAQGIPRAGKGI